MLIVTDDPFALEQKTHGSEQLRPGGGVYLADRDSLVLARATVVEADERFIRLADLERLSDEDQYYAKSEASIVAWSPGLERTTVSALRPEQEKFRQAILEAYKGRCALTGCDEDCVLDAAHLRGWRTGNEVRDGVLLRVDLHRLMDNGKLVLERDFTVRVLSQAYASLDGKKISLPRQRSDWPRLP